MRANVYETDVLVIGGGLAAARAAIAAADSGADVVLASKAPLAKSGASVMAEGGFAAALGDEGATDSPDIHLADSLAAGRGIADPALVRINVEEAAARIHDLIDFGVDFRRKGERLAQRELPGHSRARVVNAPGGPAIMNPLRRKILGYPNIHVYDDTMATRLFESKGRVTGALCLDIADGELAAFAAGATIMATGGYQELYSLSSASTDLTGDGFVLAFDAGAELIDLEILLYYPTVLLDPASLRGTILLYETFLRGKGGIGAHLVNVDGDDLVADYDQLPVRDELSRRIFEEVRRGKGTERGGVFIDISRSSLPLAERQRLVKFVSTYSRLSAVGIDMADSKLEAGPGVHTVLGGIRIDPSCATNVAGLFAAGEAAGNVHGANRLAGNALTDTQTLGFRAGQSASTFAREKGRSGVSDEQIADAARPILARLQPQTETADAMAIKHAIQRIMFERVGPTRNEEGITAALGAIASILENDVPHSQVQPDPAAYNYPLVEAMEAEFMARAAILVCHAARLRRESRGHHYRDDYPTIDDTRPPYHTSLRLCDGEIVASQYPVS